MAVSRLATGSRHQQSIASGATDGSITFTGVNGVAGANNVVVLSVQVYKSSSASLSLTATYNGTSMTAVGSLLGSASNTTANTGYQQHFVLFNPPTVSSPTVELFYDRGSFATLNFAMNTALYGGALAAEGPTQSTGAASGTAMSHDQASSADGRMHLAILSHEPLFVGVVPSSPNQTKVSDLDTPIVNGQAIWCEASGAASSVTFSATRTTGVDWSIVAMTLTADPPNEGSAGTGSYSFAGSSTGKRVPKGSSAGGGYTWVGTATGKRTPKGSGGTRAYQWAGSASGLAGKPNGTASGSYRWSGSAAGKRVPKGSGGTRNYQWAGASTGKRVPKGSGGTRPYSWAGSSTGKRSPKGSGGTRNYGWSATTAAVRTSYGGAGSPTKVARVSVGTAYQTTIASGATDGTITFPAVAAPDQLLDGYVTLAVIVYKSSSGTVALSATYNGQAMTPVGDLAGSASMTTVNTGYQQQFVIENPPASGTPEVVLSYDRTNFSTLDFACNTAAHVYVGGHSGPVTDGSNVSGGTAISLSVPSAADGRLILAVLGSEPVGGDNIVANTNHPVISELRTPTIPGKGVWVEATPTGDPTVITGTRVADNDWYAGAITLTPTALIDISPGHGGYTWAGYAGGEQERFGSVLGAAYQFSGSASGGRVSKGTGSGGYSWAGAATGRKTTSGSAGTGSYSWSGSATGEAPPDGSASGGYSWAGAASGKRVAKGSGGTRAYTFAGSAAGKRAPKGSGGTRPYGWVGASAGKRSPKGSGGTRTYSWAGAAVGANDPEGATSGGYAWAGTATGIPTPLPGEAAGEYTFAGSAAGKRVPKASGGTRAYSWSGTATGKRFAAGQAVAGFADLATDPLLRSAAYWAFSTPYSAVELTDEVDGQPAVKVTAVGSGANYPSIPFRRTTPTNTAVVPGIRFVARAQMRVPSSNVGPEKRSFLQVNVSGPGQTTQYLTSGVVDLAPDQWHTREIAGVVPDGYATLYPAAYLRINNTDGNVLYVRDMQWLVETPGTGTFGWSGEATGRRTPKGASTLSYQFAGASTGKRTPKGSGGTRAYTWIGSASGIRDYEGTATGVYGWSGVVVGGIVFSGTASGTYKFTGTIPALSMLGGPWPLLAAAPTSRIITDEVIFSLRTYNGIQLYQYPPTEQLGWRWTREGQEVSICDLTVPSQLGYNQLPDITPWLHWLDCWDDTGQVLYWSGPIVRAAANRDRLSLSARDLGVFMSRTRCPVEKRWDSADPAEIADELWSGMIEHHNLNVEPVLLRDPRGDRFDFTVNAEEGDLDVQNNRLTDLGLRWTVVAGVPIFGPVSLKANIALGAEHFVGDAFEVVRDGTMFCNDVLLRAAGAKSYGRVKAGGLQLQKTVTIDSISGVSNADRAAQQYVQYTGVMRDQVTMPEGAVLHPEAPINIQQLIPSVRLNVDAYGILSTMEVQQVTVSQSGGIPQVAVKLESVNDELPELLEIEMGAP